MQKNTLEVLTKFRTVLILDLPDFIRNFVLNLRNELDVHIKRTFNKRVKADKPIDEFEILKWLIDKIPQDMDQVPKHKHKHAVLFTCFFTKLSDALGLQLSQHMRANKNPQRCVQLSASTYKKYFNLDKDLNLKFEQNLNINFYPEKLW